MLVCDQAAPRPIYHWTVQESLPDLVADAIRNHPSVTDVTLVGSRYDGSATAVSDWDYAIDSPEPRRVFDDLPAIVESFRPIGAFWDPLADDHRNYIAIFASLVTLDLHLDLPPPTHSPWEPTRDNLAAIDTHFWNWAVWLQGKALRSEHELVASELVKMQRYLLGPLGLEKAPTTLTEAVVEYRRARAVVQETLGAEVSGSRLEAEAMALLPTSSPR